MFFQSNSTKNIDIIWIWQYVYIGTIETEQMFWRNIANYILGVEIIDRFCLQLLKYES